MLGGPSKISDKRKRGTYTYLAMWVASAAFAISCAGQNHNRNATPEPTQGMERIWYQELRFLASERLTCPVDKISYEYLHNKVHLLAGCGREVRYLVFDLDDTWVKIESFHERASANLRCRVDAIETRRLEPYKWEASGCLRSTMYVLTCENDGSTCDWVRENAI